MKLSSVVLLSTGTALYKSASSSSQAVLPATTAMVNHLAAYPQNVSFESQVKLGSTTSLPQPTRSPAPLFNQKPMNKAQKDAYDLLLTLKEQQKNPIKPDLKTLEPKEPFSVVTVPFCFNATLSPSATLNTPTLNFKSEGFFDGRQRIAAKWERTEETDFSHCNVGIASYFSAGSYIEQPSALFGLKLKDNDPLTNHDINVIGYRCAEHLDDRPMLPFTYLNTGTPYSPIIIFPDFDAAKKCAHPVPTATYQMSNVLPTIGLYGSTGNLFAGVDIPSVATMVPAWNDDSDSTKSKTTSVTTAAKFVPADTSLPSVPRYLGSADWPSQLMPAMAAGAMVLTTGLSLAASLLRKSRRQPLAMSEA